MDSPVSIFLVAGNRLLREALARILSKKNGFSVVGAIPFSKDVLVQVAESRCDILLLDSIVVERDEIDLIHEVRQAAPQSKILVIGMEDDEEFFLHAVASGVVGYVLKEASAADVVSAVRTVADDEAVCPPKLSLALFKQVARQSAEPHGFQHRVHLGLTRREQQLLPMIARGLTNKEIAAALNLSEQTVKNHLYRIMHKVGADNRLEIVHRCHIGTLVG